MHWPLIERRCHAWLPFATCSLSVLLLYRVISFLTLYTSSNYYTQFFVTPQTHTQQTTNASWKRKECASIDLSTNSLFQCTRQHAHTKEDTSCYPCMQFPCNCCNLPMQAGRGRCQVCLAVQISSRTVSPLSGKTCNGSQTYLTRCSVLRTSRICPGVGDGSSQPSAGNRETKQGFTRRRFTRALQERTPKLT